MNFVLILFTVIYLSNICWFQNDKFILAMFSVFLKKLIELYPSNNTYLKSVKNCSVILNQDNKTTAHPFKLNFKVKINSYSL